MTIVSHEHGFVFVRTRKTGGTSTELALSSLCGAKDVITPVCDRDERLREQCGGRGPQNFVGTGLVNHSPAQRIRDVVGAARWREYFTFCVERCPYEKVVSLYFHRHRVKPRPSIDDFLASGEAWDALNAPLYLDSNGEVLVNRVISYGRLEVELADVLARFGLAVPSPMPLAKSQFREDRRPACSILNDEQRQAVATGYATEFALFGGCCDHG